MSTQKYTAADVAKHNVLEGPNKSTWVIYEGGVYDITKFVSEHPGGTEVLADTAGTDITRSFTEIGHSDHARSLMTPMKVGELEGYVPGTKQTRTRQATNGAKAHSNQSAGMSPLVIAILVIIVAVVVYGAFASS